MKSLTKSGLLIVVFLLLSACAGSTPESVSFKVDMREYTYTPNTMEVKVGQVVTIELSNSGTLTHSLMIGREVLSKGDLPNGYQQDLFISTGVKPTIVGGKTLDESSSNEQMDQNNGIMVVLDPGDEKATITFTVTEEMVGEWEIGCFEDDGAHYLAGMKGRFIVDE